MSPRLTYKSPYSSPERILTTGVGGVGKTNALLSIARACPDATVYVVDNDVSHSYTRALETPVASGGYNDLSNVEVTETDPDDWEEGLDAATRYSPMCQKGDWLGFDSMSLPWSSVQSWFIDKLHGEDDAEYFFRVRQEVEQRNENARRSGGKELKTANPFEGFMDWPAINKQYFKLTKVLFRTKGHLYLTAELDKLGDKEDDDTKNVFGPYGVKPKGQKRLGHMPHTVLLLTKRRAGDYHITTMKDRNRVELEDEEYGDFAKGYLVGVAGWKRGVVK